MRLIDDKGRLLGLINIVDCGDTFCLLLWPPEWD